MYCFIKKFKNVLLTPERYNLEYFYLQELKELHQYHFLFTESYREW